MWVELLQAAGTSLQLEQERVERFSLGLEEGIRRLEVLRTHGSDVMTPSDAAGDPNGQRRGVYVEVGGAGFRRLLEFQHKLSAMPGVVRVTISSRDGERVNLEVELKAETSTP